MRITARIYYCRVLKTIGNQQITIKRPPSFCTGSIYINSFTDTITPPVNYYRANFEYVLPDKKFCESNVPFLVAIPDNDPYLNTSLLDGMKKEYKYIETTVIKGCGHCAQQEEPEIVNKLIRDFLTKHNL